MGWLQAFLTMFKVDLKVTLKCISTFSSKQSVLRLRNARVYFTGHAAPAFGSPSQLPCLPVLLLKRPRARDLQPPGCVALCCAVLVWFDRVVAYCPELQFCTTPLLDLAGCVRLAVLRCLQGLCWCSCQTGSPYQPCTTCCW